MNGFRRPDTFAEPEESFALTPNQKAELLEAIDEAERGETIDGWKLLIEING